MQRVASAEGRRVARVSNYLNKQDVFFKLRTWPAWLQAIALQQHRNRRDRFALFYFLRMNGLDPAIAASWCLMIDYVRGAPEQGNYDRNALSDQDALYAMDDRELVRRSRNKAFMDMTVGRSVRPQ